MISKRFAVGRSLMLPMHALNTPAHAATGAFHQPAPVHLTFAASTGGGMLGLGHKTSVVTPGVSLVPDRNTQWLYYMPGDISHIPFNGVDVLTGKMSGCPLVVFRHGGVVHAGHIGTADNRPVQNAAVLLAWNTWAAANPGDVIAGFYPAAPWVNMPAGNQGQGWGILGLMTAGHHHFYSMVIYRQSNITDEWRVAGLHKHQTLTNAQLQALT